MYGHRCGHWEESLELSTRFSVVSIDTGRDGQTCLAKRIFQARAGTRKCFPVQLTMNRIGKFPVDLYSAINIYTKSFELSRASISDTCSLVALELFFCDFSVPRPLLALVLATCGSPRQ